MPKISNERKLERRTSIINAAITLFAQKGFHDVNSAELAAYAGVAEGTIFHYFKTKDDILLHALPEVVHRLIVALRREDDTEQPVNVRLLRFVGNHIRLARENPVLARFLIVELRQTPEFLVRYPGFHPLSEYLDFLREILSAGMEDGSLRNVDLECAVAVIFGTMDFILTQWHFGESDTDPEVMLAFLRDIIYNGLKPEVK